MKIHSILLRFRFKKAFLWAGRVCLRRRARGMDNVRRRVVPRLLSFFCLGFLAMVSKADLVELRPAADTTLHEFWSNNNLGGHTHVAAGATGSPKPDGALFRTRGLFRFDLAGQIPPGSVITAAVLTLTVTFTPGGGSSSDYQLHRVLRPWGEGVKTSNSGQPATTGEANWTMRFLPGETWDTPGGTARIDYAVRGSAGAHVGGPGNYKFGSTSNLVADVQAWLDKPAENFGWMLISSSEDVPQTARRFSSRESGAAAPLLRIEYQAAAPPPKDLSLTGITVADGLVTLTWTNGQPGFQVQKATSLALLDWADAGPPTTNSSATLPAPDATAFYRVLGGQLIATLPPMARYEVTFDAVWSPTTHPQDYPSGAHWSGLAGGTHNDKVTFWTEGQLATDGIKNVAELGSKTRLLQEIDAAIAAGTADGRLSGGGIGSGSGRVQLTFEIRREFPRVTLVSMIAPSPDWFVGVGNLTLIENSAWIAEKKITLFLYDAGTDSGPSYASPDQVTTPREFIRKIAGFPALVNGQVVPFGTFIFRRQPL